VAAGYPVDTTQRGAYYRDLGDAALVTAFADGPAAYEPATWEAIADEISARRKRFSHSSTDQQSADSQQLFPDTQLQSLRDEMVALREAAEGRSRVGIGFVVVGVGVTFGSFLVAPGTGFVVIAWGVVVAGIIRIARASNAHERAKNAIEAIDSASATLSA